MIRPADTADAESVFVLAAALATSFTPTRERFDTAFSRLVTDDRAALLIHEVGGRPVAYLLGFEHDTFFADGPVGWVEELIVAEPQRGQGVGRALLAAFEAWAISRNCRLVALATRRAGGFYAEVGYEASATYFRKVLPTI